MTTIENNIPGKCSFKELYNSIEEILRDIKWLQYEVTKFKIDLIRYINGTGTYVLYEALQQYEEIQLKLRRIRSYLELHAISDLLEDDVISTTHAFIEEKLAIIEGYIIFFPSYIARISPQELDIKLERVDIIHEFRPWLKHAAIPYPLEITLEELCKHKNITCRQALIKFYDRTLEEFSIELDGGKCNIVQVNQLMFSHDEQKRYQIAHKMEEKLKSMMDWGQLMFNSLAKDYIIEAGMRYATNPLLPSGDVNDLIFIMETPSFYKTVSRNYYNLKAKILGKDKLNHWDMNASVADIWTKTYSWNEAKDLILDTYYKFSYELGFEARKFFDKHWIDAEVRPKKSPYTYLYSTTAKLHPYIFMQYRGTFSDVLDLAKAIAKGVHHMMASKKGELCYRASEPFAEVSSLVIEHLILTNLEKAALTLRERTAYRMLKIEKLLGQITKNLALYEFEEYIYERRYSYVLELKDFYKAWVYIQQQYLGQSVDLAGYQYFWLLEQNLFHKPLRTYENSKSACVVATLLHYSQERPEDFLTIYVSLLSAGDFLDDELLYNSFEEDKPPICKWVEGSYYLQNLITELEKEWQEEQ